MGGVRKVDAVQKLLVARQVKAEILFQPQYVAGQRRTLFLLVGLVGHPEQETDTADEQDEGQSRQDPQPAPTAGALRRRGRRTKVHAAILARQTAPGDAFADIHNSQGHRGRGKFVTPQRAEW